MEKLRHSLDPGGYISGSPGLEEEECGPPSQCYGGSKQYLAATWFDTLEAQE